MRRNEKKKRFNSRLGKRRKMKRSNEGMSFDNKSKRDSNELQT